MRPRPPRRATMLALVAAVVCVGLLVRVFSEVLSRSSPGTTMSSAPRRAGFPTLQPIKIDIFIRTYTGDGHWLIYLLRSFERYLSPRAYRTVHVVTDAGPDADFAERVVALFPTLRARVVGQTVERWMTSHNNGSYHAQMLSKLTADTVAAGADVVCYFDSDNRLTGPLHAADFVRADGAVGVAPLPFANLTAEREAWQPGCQALLKTLPCEYETMTGFPICYPTDIFPAFNAHIQAVHNASLIPVLKTLKNWNEFTPLGAFLMATRPHGGRGGWYVKPQAHPHVLQAWSWGGFDPAAVARWEAALRARPAVEGGVAC